LNLSELSYTIFDFETTGLYPEEGDEIIELGAVIVERGEILEKTYQTLVNPGRSIPAISTKISGIRDEDVAKSPPIADVLDNFLDFMGPRIWVAQNAKFDMGFLIKSMSRLNKSLRQNIVVDTIGISKILFPYENSHNLDVLMNRMGILRSGERHRSLDDCRYTAQILIEFIKLLEKQGINSLPQIETAFIKVDSLVKTDKPKTRSLFG